MIHVRDYNWVHVNCVNWLNEIWFEEKPERKNIEGKVIEHMGKKKCSICCKTQGATINCDFPKCKKRFHVRCAIKTSLIKDDEAMELYKVSDWTVRIFCSSHQKQGLELVEKERGRASKRLRLEPEQLTENSIDFLYVNAGSKQRANRIIEDIDEDKLSDKDFKQGPSVFEMEPVVDTVPSKKRYTAKKGAKKAAYQPKPEIVEK